MRTAPGILIQLVEQARAETSERRRWLPPEEIEGALAAGTVPQARDFRAALRREDLSLIAEMKSRTPSMGVLMGDGYSPAGLAREYTRAGAAAVSVLTHQEGFGGSLEHLAEARGATDLPLLRKDFITDAYQVLEARRAGADAVLLIVAVLDAGDLAELIRTTRRLGMEALVEVHDQAEVEAALEAGAEVIGINNRDLRTFSVDLGLTERLRPLIPAGRVVVAESGIHTQADARRMRAAGADAVLVGEALMRAADAVAAARELIS